MEKHLSTELTSAEQSILPVLQRLSTQIDHGIDALVRQDLEGFERCVAEQSETCELLQSSTMLGTNAPEMLNKGHSAAVTQAARHLEHQKRVYAALLVRSMRSVQTVLGLYQSCIGYSAQGTLPLEGSTWSSEV